MEFDKDRLVKEMVGIVAEALSISAGMDALLDYCAEMLPDNRWDSLRAMDYERDIVVLKQWVTDVLTAEPPDSVTRALWFEIHDDVTEDAFFAVHGTFGLCVYGTSEADNLDGTYHPGDLDWLYTTEENYLPDHPFAPDTPYAKSSVLDTIFVTTQSREDTAILGEYVLCLGYVCLLFPVVVELLDRDLLLGTLERRYALARLYESYTVYLGAMGAFQI